jgi:hypothetical protein
MRPHIAFTDMAGESELAYEPIPKFSPDQIEECVARNEPNELLHAVLSAALYAEDRDFAEHVCLTLAGHEHFNVRGNALLGFAHIARIYGKLNEPKVRPLLEKGLNDQDDYVRGQAEGAREDIEHFLGWTF